MWLIPQPHPALPRENRTSLEDHYEAIQQEVRMLLRTLKIPA